MKYPREFGRVVEDLSSDAPPNTSKSLYVILTDENGRDFKAPPKPYGVFWSAEGPGPVNNIAIELWPKFGSVKSRRRILMAGMLRWVCMSELWSDSIVHVCE